MAGSKQHCSSKARVVARTTSPDEAGMMVEGPGVTLDYT